MRDVWGGGGGGGDISVARYEPHLSPDSAYLYVGIFNG